MDEARCRYPGRPASHTTRCGPRTAPVDEPAELIPVGPEPDEAEPAEEPEAEPEAPAAPEPAPEEGDK